MSDTNLRDGSGNPITSTGNALDVNIKTGGTGGGGGSNAAAGLTGSVIPTSASYTGFNSGGNLIGVSSVAPLPVTLGGTQAVSIAVLPVAPANTGVDIGNVGLKAGSAVIGHVIVDSGAIAATLSAETTKVIGTVNIASGQSIALAAGAAVIGHVINDASTAVIGHVIVDSGAISATLSAETTKIIGTVNVAASQSIAVTNAGTFAVQATLSAETTKVIGTINVASGQTIGLAAGAAVIGHVIVDSAPSTAVTNAGTFAVQATLAAETTKVIGTVNVAAAQTIAVTQATAANLNATVVQATPANLQVTATPIALTKATQGATGFSTQDLKDAGRSARVILLDSFAVAATAETLMTMSYSSDNGTLTTGTSYAVTTAKRLRIQSINVGLHTITGNTTAVNVIVRLRVNNGGAALVSSPVQMVIPIQGIAAANQAGIPVDITIPDGWEFVAGAGIGVTVACAGFVTTTAAPKVDISIVGYEY